MTYLSLPPGRDEVQANDFTKLASKHLSPHLSNKYTMITGEELYSARCGVVHTYTIESKKTKQANIRKIGYAIEGDAPPMISSSKVPDSILLRLDTLRDAFFKAIDRFLIEAYADKAKQPKLEMRMKKLLMAIPRRQALLARE